MSVSNVSNAVPRKFDSSAAITADVARPQAEKARSETSSLPARQDRSSFESGRKALVTLDATPAFTPLRSLSLGQAAQPAAANVLNLASGSGPVETPEQAFILQFRDPTWNPTGPLGSANCGPASLAMTMAFMGRMPPGLSKEQQVDFARAIMCPGRSGEFTWIRDANGQSVPQLDRDHDFTGGTMEEDGVRAAGGNPQYMQGWENLDRALMNGPVISNGYTDQAWRNQFPQRMGSGDVGHINTILGKTSDGRYIVCDPLHTGGPTYMTRDQLAVFYSHNPGGLPDFVATNFGSTGPVNPGDPQVPQTNLTFDGGANYNPEVEKLQRCLVKCGYLSQADMDTGAGYYGNRTKAAVARLQAEFGIQDDGSNFGPRTRAALSQKLGSIQPPPPPPPPDVQVPQTNLTFDGGANYNPEVEKLQRCLVKAGYLSQADMDTGAGYYGNRTKAAVARLQAEFGIADDGSNFGPRTRAALTQKLGL